MLVYFLRYGKNELLGHKVLADGEGVAGGERGDSLALRLAALMDGPRLGLLPGQLG